MEDNSSQNRIVDQVIGAVNRVMSSGSDTHKNPTVPDDPAFDQLFDQGIEAMQQQAHEEAIDAFTRAIAIYGDNAPTYANRARSYWGLNALDQAADDFLEALILNPADPESLVCLGEVMAQNERHVQAIKILECAVSHMSKAGQGYRELVGPRAHYYLASAQLALNDLDNAMSNARRALRLAHQDSDVLELSGRVRSAMGDHAYAIQDLDAAIALEKEDPNLYHSRARIHLSAGDERLADNDLQSAVDLSADDADAAFDLGIQMMDLDNANWAIDSLTHALRLAPDNADAWYYRGALKVDTDLQSAGPDVDQALKLDPEMAEAHILQGYVLMDRGQDHDAISAFKRGVGLVPDDAENQAALGNGHLAAKQFHEALTCFELALKIDDQCDTARLGRARLYTDLGDPDSALKDIQFVLQNDPTRTEAKLLRGAVMMDLDKYDAAAADFQQELEHSPESDRAIVLVALALAHIEQGNIAEAAARLDEAGSLPPHEPEFHYARAALEEKQSHYQDAARHIDTALQANDTEAHFYELKGDIMAGMGNIAAAKGEYDTALRLAVSNKDKQELGEKLAKLEL